MMIFRIFIALLFLSTVAIAQNTKPLISTDNGSNTCNTTRMVFPVGALSCSGSVATVTTGTGGAWTITDGSHTVANVTNVTVTGGTVGGSTPNATLTVTGGSSTPGGLLNSIQYYGAGPSFAGSNSFVYNGTNVGIGTSTAGKQLTVGSTGQATIDSNGIYTTSNAGSASTPSYQLSAGNGLYLNAANDPAITAASAIQSYWNQGAGGGFNEVINQNAESSINSYNTNGGTGAFADFVANNGTNTLTAAIFGTGWSTIGPDIQNQATLQTGSGGLNFSATNGQMTWWTNSNQRMILNNGGNVGIGTVNPGTVLDVTGTVRMTGFNLSTSPTNGYVLTADAGGNGTWGPQTGGSGTINSGTSNRPAYYSGSTTLSSGTGFYNGTNVSIGTTVNKDFLDVAGGVSIGTTYAGYQTAPSNGLAVQGNVGIGTFTAFAALDVENPAAAVQAQFGNTIPFYLISNSPNLGFNSYYNSGWKYGKGSSSVYGASMGFAQGAGDLVYAVSSTTGNSDAAIAALNILFTVKQNGNVGIGSPIPGAVLDVTGGIRSSLGTAGQSTCWKADKSLGQCTSAVGAGGACTCA